jgi:hypothetical protein
MRRAWIAPESRVLSMNLTPDSGYRKAKRLVEELRAKMPSWAKNYTQGKAELAE